MKNAKRIAAVFLSVLIVASTFTGCEVSTSDIQNQASLVDVAESAKEKIIDAYSKVKKKDFQEGWEHAVEFATSTGAAQKGSQYVGKVAESIDKFRVDMNEFKGSARGVKQEAGFVAEKWHADTFNIDSAARGSSETAETVNSHANASPDIKTSYGEEASLKYYKTASKSAEAQAKSILEKYYNYCDNAKGTPMTLGEYLDKNGYDAKSESQLMKSIYEGQTRIIPQDQYAAAVDYLNGRISEMDLRDSAKAAGKSDAYVETLSELKDCLESPSGTKSTPVTKEKIEQVTELCQDGDFKPEDFGFTVSQIITPKYIVKQAINTGAKTATLNAALTMGPEIYAILVEAAKTGKIDKAELKKTGVDGVLAGSEGFVEGSVSNVILVACQAGKFGPSLTNASPEVVGALTVLTIDAIRYGYALSKGEITAEEYGSLLAEEVVISSGSLAAGMAVTAFLGNSVVLCMAGCLAGGMLTAIGFNMGKTALLEIQDGGGFAALVPTESIKGIVIEKGTVAKLGLQEKASTFKDMTVTTLKNGTIKIKSIGS